MTGKKSFFNSVIIGVGLFFCIALTACENFLSGGLLKKQLQADIEYAKAPFYTIKVEAVENSGKIKTPVSGEIEKKVTDMFTVKFEPASNYEFIKWEAYFTDKTESDEKISDYIEFEDEKELETKVTLKKAYPSLGIRPVCPEKLTYNIFPGNGEQVPRDSSIEITFNKTLGSTELGSENNFITIQDLSAQEVSTYYKKAEIKEQKLVFYANTENGYIPVSNNQTKKIDVKIGKDCIYYVNTYYSYPVTVTLDEDIDKTFYVNASTSKKTKIKFKIREEEEQPVGTLKIDGEEYHGGEKSYSVGQTIALRYKIPDEYTFDNWYFYDEIFTELQPENLSLAFDDDDENNLIQRTIKINNYIEGSILIIPEIYKTLEVSDFNLKDSETYYNRDSDIILTFNESISSECIDKLSISIKDLPPGKTSEDYFEPPVLNGKVLLIKAKNSFAEDLIPLSKNGTNLITILLGKDDFFYKTTSTTGTEKEVTFDTDKIFSYKIDSQTKNKTMFRFILDEENSSGTIKVDGESNTNQATGYSIGSKILLNYILSKDEQNDYMFKNWKLTYTYIDAEENLQTDTMAVTDTDALSALKISFVNYSVETSNNNTVYSAEITVNGSVDGTITLQPQLQYITDIRVKIDGEHGKFSPAKGFYFYKLGQQNHIEFEPDSDYEFIRWQLINTKDGIEFARSDKDGSYAYIRSADLQKEKADFEIIELPDDEDTVFELRPLIAERPQIISNTPINTALVNKDTTIQVMFDYDMDESSIYYLEEEVKQLRQTLGIPENELSNSAAGENLNTLLVTTIAGEQKYYGYTKGSESFFKNISITNNRTSENITGFFDKPVFENPRTLSINVKREGGIKLLQYTQVLVNIDKGFSYIKDEKAVSMAGSKKWVYQVNNETDNVGPGFSTVAFKIGEQALEGTENVPGITEDAITVSQLPYYSKNTFNLKLKVDDGTGGSAGTNFTLACKKEYDENYNIIENPIVTNVGIDFDYTAGQIAEYNGNCADLYKLSSGVYSISIIARDKSGNETVYTPADTDHPNLKNYIVIDKTGPAIPKEALTFADLEEEKAIKPVWDYSSVPDYNHADIYYAAYNISSYTYSPNQKYTVAKGADTKLSNIIAGTKYRFDVYYFDHLGNSTNRWYYYAYTIPAKPKNVSVSTDYGTSETITAGKPDEGACSAIKVQYRIKGETSWTNTQDISTSSSASGSLTVSGLSKGQIYEFNIRSYDSDSGKYSLSYKDDSDNYPTFTTVPDAPASIATSFQSYTNQGNVSWTAPSSGSVTGYKVYCSTSSSYAEDSTQTYTADSSTFSHTFTNLVPGTYYYVKVLTYYGNTDNVSSVKTTSTYTKPVAPTDLTCSSRTDNSITLSWKKPDSGYWSYYELKYKKSSDSSWSTAASSINKDAIQYTISGLSAGETYNFNLRSKYQTAYSTDVQATYQLCPAAASNLAATKISDTSFKASWTAPAGNYDGYNLYISNTESGLASVGPINLGKSTTEYTKTNLTSKGLYYIKLETYIGTYNSNARLKTDTEVLGISLAFDAVKSLSTSNLTSTGFNLTWTNPSISFDGIEIYNGSTKVTTLSNTTTSYSVSDLTPNTSYTYKVVTYKGSGSSRLAAEATVNKVTLSSPVTYPSVTAVSPTSVRISWTNPSSSSYYSSIYIYNATTAETIDVTKGSTSYTVTELDAGKAYTFRVRTRNSSNAASTYTAKSVTTPPAPVTSLTSLSTGTTSKTISWVKPTGTFTGVYVYYKLSSASSYTLAQTISNTTTTQATITGLSAGNTYNFKVTTYLSGVSNVGTSSEATLTSYTAPPAVTNFAVTRDSTYGNYLTFSWTNPAASNYEYVTLYYKKANTSSWSSTQITKGDTSKKLNLSYGYRYEAYALTYYKGYSTYSSVYTPSAPLKTMTVPSNPYNFTVTSNLGKLIFTWDIGSGEHNYYRVQYRLYGNTTWNNFAWITKSEGADGQWEVTDTDRNNGLKYEFRMYSQMDYSDYGGEIDSPYSGTQEYYTPPPKIDSIRQGVGWNSETNSAFKSITLTNWANIKDIPGYVNVYVNGVYKTSSVTVGSNSSYVKLGYDDLKNGDTVYIVTYHKKNANHSESIYLGGKYLSVWSDETYGEIFSFTWNFD